MAHNQKEESLIPVGERASSSRSNRVLLKPPCCQETIAILNAGYWINSNSVEHSSPTPSSNSAKFAQHSMDNSSGVKSPQSFASSITSTQAEQQKQRVGQLNEELCQKDEYIKELESRLQNVLFRDRSDFSQTAELFDTVERQNQQIKELYKKMYEIRENRDQIAEENLKLRKKLAELKSAQKQ
ncbi:unnamed protein product [Caenorhabditis angaria]|uniref:Uncharacterized protein n=1 Tax=Caenorhabditis angaria TaxID=860376 RepID=A0A9P1J3L9_9PELO|nr:unnamed protein product [Caenorhabditis angaria]